MKQETWMPLKGPDEYGNDLDWLADHLGDAYYSMVGMWQQICKDHPELPIDGFADNDNLGAEIPEAPLPEPPVMSAEAIRVLDERVLVTVRKAAEDGRITTDEAVALLKYLSIPHHARRSRAELRQNATAKADAVGEPVRQAVERHTGKDTGGLEQLEVFGKLDKELSSIYAATEGKLLNEEEFLALTDIYGMVLRLKTLINTGESPPGPASTAEDLKFVMEGARWLIKRWEDLPAELQDSTRTMVH